MHAFQLEKAGCLFQHGATGQNYVPRCVLIDLDPNSLDSIRCSPNGQIFRPDNFIFGQAGSGNNFARAKYAAGVEIRDIILERVRYEAEMCDSLVGFQMLSGIGGGTGSGLGSLITEHVKDEFPKQLVFNYTIVPGEHIGSEAVVQPINATLAVPSLVNFSDMTICADNHHLYQICDKTLRLEAPIYDDINSLLAKVISGISCPYRFPSTSYIGWKSMSCVMVPTPKLHFFIPGFVPLNSRGVQCYRTFSVHDITYQMLNLQHVMQGPGIDRADYIGGKCITALALYRGMSVREEEVIQHLANFEAWNADEFVDWMPFHFVKGICEVPPVGTKISSTLLMNHTGAQRALWGGVLRNFRAMYNKKAFFHWFYTEGLGDDDIKVAEECLYQLLEDYKCCETQPPEGWKGFDENEMFNTCLREEQEDYFNEYVKKKVATYVTEIC